MPFDPSARISTLPAEFSKNFNSSRASRSSSTTTALMGMGIGAFKLGDGCRESSLGLPLAITQPFLPQTAPEYSLGASQERTRFRIRRALGLVPDFVIL